MLRPTLSLALYLQMCGRAMRPAPGKPHSVICDHVGNALRLGLPDDPQEWTLADKPKRPGRAPVCGCPRCGLIVAAGCRVCPHCGAELAAVEAPPVTAAGRLVEADPAVMQRLRLRAMSRARQLRWAGGDYQRLKLIGELRGYHPGWAGYELERRKRGEGES
jgi:superfamily II DNA or RNA helicase